MPSGEDYAANQAPNPADGTTTIPPQAVAAAGLPTRGLGGPASARQGGPAEPPASMQDQAHVLPTPSTDPSHPVLSVWYRADLRMAVANDRHADIR